MTEETNQTSTNTEAKDQETKAQAVQPETATNTDQTQNVTEPVSTADTSTTTVANQPTDTQNAGQETQPTNSTSTEAAPDSNTAPANNGAVKEDDPTPTSESKSDTQSTPAPADKVTQATKPSQPTVSSDIAIQPDKLSDYLPGEGTNIVYISGTLGGKDYDCAGPVEMPFKLTKPLWPFTPIEPNPEYKNQTFDYLTGQWVPTDAKSQGQILTDLQKQVSDLDELPIQAEQNNKVAVQTTKALTELVLQVGKLTNKVDALVKDGDK